jgi:cytochrome P450
LNQHAFPMVEAAPFVDPRTLMEDPHRRFAVLRAEHPVIRIGEGQYMVLRAEDVFALLTDQRTKQVEGPDWVGLNRIADGAMARFLSDFFLLSNGDAHRKRRGLFARSFSHRTMRESRERIRAVADTIVAELPRGEGFDFVAAMAARVPAEMIAAILGLPQSEAPHFYGMVYDVARGVTTIYPHDKWNCLSRPSPNSRSSTSPASWTAMPPGAPRRARRGHAQRRQADRRRLARAEDYARRRARPGGGGEAVGHRR